MCLAALPRWIEVIPSSAGAACDFLAEPGLTSIHRGRAARHKPKKIFLKNPKPVFFTLSAAFVIYQFEESAR
jgi:hypothetical protein